MPKASQSEWRLSVAPLPQKDKSGRRACAPRPDNVLTWWRRDDAVRSVLRGRLVVVVGARAGTMAGAAAGTILAELLHVRLLLLQLLQLIRRQDLLHGSLNFLLDRFHPGLHFFH